MQSLAGSANSASSIPFEYDGLCDWVNLYSSNHSSYLDIERDIARKEMLKWKYLAKKTRTDFNKFFSDFQVNST